MSRLSCLQVSGLQRLCEQGLTLPSITAGLLLA